MIKGRVPEIPQKTGIPLTDDAHLRGRAWNRQRAALRDWEVAGGLTLRLAVEIVIDGTVCDVAAVIDEHNGGVWWRRRRRRCSRCRRRYRRRYDRKYRVWSGICRICQKTEVTVRWEPVAIAGLNSTAVRGYADDDSIIPRITANRVYIPRVVLRDQDYRESAKWRGEGDIEYARGWFA